MKIIKPLTLGTLSKPYRHAGQDHLAVAVYGFFRLGGTPASRFLTENLQWPDIITSLPKEQPLDEVMPKRQGEVLLSGYAHAPGGQPVTEMAVRLQCAGIDKALRVTGDRQWLYGLLPWYRVTAPEPFLTMPLGWERAFGGPRHPGNPVGRGYTGNPLAGLIGRNRGFLPNVQAPGQIIRKHWRRVAASGYGPLDLRWTPRFGRGGSYDAAWLAQDAPGLARNIDWRIFNRAPEDQWLPGYFQGGESYCLEGMSPDQPQLAGCLPTTRMRAFVQRQGADQPFEEVPLQWDTVWFFPEHALGVVVWHGQCAIKDCDGLDIHALMAAYEAASTTRPLAHYQQVGEWRSNPATAAAHLFNEAQLAPARDAEEEARLTLAREAAARQREQQRQQQLAAVTADLAAACAEAGLDLPELPPVPAPALTPPSSADIQAGDFDLSDYLAQAKALAAQLQQQAAAKQAELEAAQAELRQQLPPQPLLAQAEAEQQAWEEALEKALRPALDLVGGSPESDPDCRQLLEQWATQPPADAAAAAARQQALQGVIQAKALQRQGRRAAPKATPPELPAAVAQRLGQQVRAWLDAGICLAGRDLAGADLRGLDLRGLDLRETQLERADLRGVRLDQARLAGAVLCEARLDGACFDHADLSGANLCHSQAHGASFRHARLQQARTQGADWQEADLAHACLDQLVSQGWQLIRACLDGTQATNTILAGAVLTDCRAQGVNWLRVVALGAQAERADFSGGELDSCVWLDARLLGSHWRGSKLTRVQTGGKADWSGADLSHARLFQCGFNGSRLSAATLADMEARKTDFGNCDLTAVDLSGALLSESLFYGARLNRSRAPGSDWFRALCRKTDFSDADLSHANLVQAELSGACFDRTQMTGVSLDANRRAA